MALCQRSHALPRRLIRAVTDFRKSENKLTKFPKKNNVNLLSDFQEDEQDTPITPHPSGDAYSKGGLQRKSPPCAGVKESQFSGRRGMCTHVTREVIKGVSEGLESKDRDLRLAYPAADPASAAKSSRKEKVQGRGAASHFNTRVTGYGHENLRIEPVLLYDLRPA